jgi:hypothetical protein
LKRYGNVEVSKHKFSPGDSAPFVGFVFTARTRLVGLRTLARGARRPDTWDRRIFSTPPRAHDTIDRSPTKVE